MDLEELGIEVDREAEVGPASPAERAALWVVRLACLPLMLAGLVLWATILGVAAAGRGLAALASQPARHLDEIPKGMPTPVGPREA